MNQSEIAIRVAQYLQTKDEVLYKWQDGKYTYGIYGPKQTDLVKLRQVVEELTGTDILKKCRQYATINARRAFSFIAIYTTTGFSLNKIKLEMGIDNHATVIHHRNKMKDLIAVGDVESINLISLICKRLDLMFTRTRSDEK